MNKNKKILITEKIGFIGFHIKYNLKVIPLFIM